MSKHIPVFPNPMFPWYSSRRNGDNETVFTDCRMSDVFMDWEIKWELTAIWAHAIRLTNPSLIHGWSAGYQGRAIDLTTGQCSNRNLYLWRIGGDEKFTANSREHRWPSEEKNQFFWRYQQFWWELCKIFLQPDSDQAHQSQDCGLQIPIFFLRRTQDPWRKHWFRARVRNYTT